MEGSVSTPAASSNTAASSPAAPTQSSVQAENQATSLVRNSTSSSAEPSNANSTRSAEEFYDVKIDGKVHKMSREELISHAQMSKAAHAKFEEAAKVRKQMERIAQTVKKNPIEALMDPSLGLSKNQIRAAMEEWYEREFIHPSTLSPEQLKMKELEREVMSYRKQQEMAQQKAEQDQLNQATEQQRTLLQEKIVQGMEKTGLPINRELAKRVAFYMKQAHQQGWDAPIEFIANQVKKEYREMNANISKDASVEQIISIFGEEIVQKINQHYLKQLRDKRNSLAKQDTRDTPSYGRPREVKKGSYDVEERLNLLKQGKL